MWTMSRQFVLCSLGNRFSLKFVSSPTPALGLSISCTYSAAGSCRLKSTFKVKVLLPGIQWDRDADKRIWLHQSVVSTLWHVSASTSKLSQGSYRRDHISKCHWNILQTTRWSKRILTCAHYIAWKVMTIVYGGKRVYQARMNGETTINIGHWHQWMPFYLPIDWCWHRCWAKKIIAFVIIIGDNDP